VADKTCAGDFLAGLLVGALVGAAAALLLAPQSGEETRTLIREKGVELGHRADEFSLEARQRAEELQSRMKQAVDEGKATATHKKEELLSQVGAKATDETPAAG
jgi:gas vesicle protein